jgi:transposase
MLEKSVYSIAEVADIFGVHRSTIYRNLLGLGTL